MLKQFKRIQCPDCQEQGDIFFGLGWGTDILPPLAIFALFAGALYLTITGSRIATQLIAGLAAAYLGLNSFIILRWVIDWPNVWRTMIGDFTIRLRDRQGNLHFHHRMYDWNPKEFTVEKIS